MYQFTWAATGQSEFLGATAVSLNSVGFKDPVELSVPGAGSVDLLQRSGGHWSTYCVFPDTTVVRAARGPGLRVTQGSFRFHLVE